MDFPSAGGHSISLGVSVTEHAPAPSTTQELASPWPAMVIMMLALLLMSWCSPKPAHAQTVDLPAFLDRYQYQLAARRVERYRMALGFASPITISVDREEEMPRMQRSEQRVEAHTTREWLEDGRTGAGCVVHVTKLSMQKASVLAHEVCHCAWDHTVLGPWGYVGLTAEERRGRERRADECMDGLLKGAVQ